MKKVLFLLTLIMSSMTFFSSCSDEKEVLPPTKEEIVNTSYSGATLKATLDGEPLGETSAVSILKDKNDSLSIQLKNIIPGADEFLITGASFEGTTRAQVSKISGKTAEYVLGIEVYAEAIVENGLMILTVKIKDIINTYTTSNLKLTIDGEPAQEAAIVSILKDKEAVYSILFKDAFPRIKELTIPNATFESATKAYVGNLSGELSDDLLGLLIKAKGVVDADILTMDVTTTELVGDTVNTKPFHNKVYKGDMTVDAPPLEPVTDVQRIYILSQAKDTAAFRLQIKNFSFMGTPIGNILVDQITMTQRGNVYAFSATDREISLSLTGKPEDAVKVKIDLKGTIVDDEMSLDLAINAEGVLVDVDFEGETVDESKENKLLNITFDKNDAILDPIKASTKMIMKVWADTPAADLLITPAFEVSKGASIASISTNIDNVLQPINVGEVIDFSKFNSADYLEIKVAAEDPNAISTSKLYVEKIQALEETRWDFTKWTEIGESGFNEPIAWSSSNAAAMFLKLFGDQYYPANVPYPVSQKGDVASIITVDTKGGYVMTVIPAVTAGTMFLGSFEIDIMNTLKSTKFGLPFRKEPLTFKGEYKYKAGTEYFETKVETIDGKKVVSSVPVPDRIDFCSINAVLYEVKNFTESLTGLDANTSDKIVAIASLADGSDKTDFTQFDVNFNYLPGKSFDSSKKYKFAIICSSSAKGDNFEGAPGSELQIKSLEITTK